MLSRYTSAITVPVSPSSVKVTLFIDESVRLSLSEMFVPQWGHRSNMLLHEPLKRSIREM